MKNTGTASWGKWELVVRTSGGYEGFTFLNVTGNNGVCRYAWMWEPQIEITKKHINHALRKIRTDMIEEMK
jgi:hypothetical protein